MNFYVEYQSVHRCSVIMQSNFDAYDLDEIVDNIVSACCNLEENNSYFLPIRIYKRTEGDMPSPILSSLKMRIFDKLIAIDNMQRVIEEASDDHLFFSYFDACDDFSVTQNGTLNPNNIEHVCEDEEIYNSDVLENFRELYRNYYGEDDKEDNEENNEKEYKYYIKKEGGD